jgi:hypothetical protein
MRRPLCTVVIIAQFLVFASVPQLSADEPSSTRPSQRRLTIEKLLDRPLQWNLEKQESVTLEAMIEHVRANHHLHIRWDLNSLEPVFGEQSFISEFISTAANRQTDHVASCFAPGVNLNSAPLAAVNDAGAPSSSAISPYSEPAQVSSYPQTAQVNPYVSTPPQYAVPQAGVTPENASTAATYPQAPQSPANINSPPAVASLASPYDPPKLPTEQPSQSASTPATESTADVTPNSTTAAEPQPGTSTETGVAALIAACESSPIPLSALSLEQATVREALRQMLDATTPSTSAILIPVGVPITTRALALDLLVDENSVLITTRLRANSRKETRTYRLGSLSELPPESLERVITHSIRPWSWRSQANEIAEQLASHWQDTSAELPNIDWNATNGITLKPAEQAAAGANPANALSNVNANTIAATGKLVAGGALATVNSVVAALEIMHHGDPPTGVIESLPGFLIITQSQAAHREIEELLHDLSAAE